MPDRSDTTQPNADEHGPLIVIVSNRGPYSFKAKRDGSFVHKRGAGGLVTALSALAEKHDVLWVAAALSRGDRAWAKQHNFGVSDVDGLKLQLVNLESRRYEQFYNQISNPLLWFIQHQMWDAPRKPSITKETWDAWRQGYVAVNRQFADVVADTVQGVERPVMILPQDYHLYLMPKFLRERLGRWVQIQPFVHIPWPGPDGWQILPEAMRKDLLISLLQSDRVGFQTKKDAFNFVQTCRFYLTDAHSHGSRDSIEYLGRKVEARTYPISVDVEKVERLVDDVETRRFRSELMSFVGDRRLILRTDRVEPSKNIIRGLYSYRALLETYPEHRGKVQMLALLVPSRMEVSEYQDYLQEIMAEAGFINAEFSDGSWEPVRIILGDNYLRALAAMQLYDVLLVNPIADGMNLVAKEGVLVNQNDGVLLLSEHAGAVYELGDDALTVSPFDVHSAAHELNRALTMPWEERHERAESLRERVRSADVKRWFYAQVEDALRASNNHDRNASTPATPGSMASAFAIMAGGVSSDSTPRPNA